MKNFINTEWEHLTEEEIFEINQNLVISTISKKFPNNRAFCKTHMFELDDLIQLGNLGLLYAIRTYDSSNSASFMTYAINNIVWSITRLARKESLRTINKQSYDLRDMVSIDKSIKNNSSGNDEEEWLISNTLQSSNDTSTTAEERVLIYQAKEFLRQDPNINEDLLYIFTSLIEGKTIVQLADELGVTKQALYQRVASKKALKIKNRFRNFLLSTN